MSEITITAKEIQEAAAKTYKPYTDAEWRGLTLRVKQHLSLAETVQFADSVVHSCFITDSGEYIPEVKDFSMRCAILGYYADITLPEELEAKHDLVYNSDIVSFVIQHVDMEQFNYLREAIDKKIDHITQSNSEAIEMLKKQIVAGFDALGEKFSEIFNGVDSDMISKLASAVVDGSFDEKKLVQAFKSTAVDVGNVVKTPSKSEDK